MEEHNSQAKQSCSNGGSRDGVGGNSFDCNICLELAQDPVVTLCGHLFCWPCIYRWLHAHSIAQECPVCKALLRQERLIPLYGAGKTDLNSTLRKPLPTGRGGGGTIPQRPTGQRPTITDPTMLSNDHHEMRHRFNSMSGPHHGGLGHFPILFGLHGFADHALLSPSTSSRPGNQRMASPAPPQNAFHLPDRPLEEALLNKLFVFFACFVVVCLLFF